MFGSNRAWLRFAGVSTLAFALVASGPADAQRIRHLDRVGDVTFMSFPDLEESAAPQHTNGDFAGVRVLHTATDVKIYARFVGLSPSGQGITMSGIIFKKEFNPIHAYRYFVEWDPIGTPGCDQPVQRCWTFRNYLNPETDEVPDPVTCNGMTFKVDFGENRVFLKIPRTCLGNPKAVRVSLESGHQTSEGSYFDNAFGGRPNDTGITDFIPAG